MTLLTIDLAAPRELRGEWAALAALLDGGRAVMFGNDHEFSDTYFREAAEYFGEEETDLLAEAPAWWGENIAHSYGEWTGFIYGWDGERWQRAGCRRGETVLGGPTRLSQKSGGSRGRDSDPLDRAGAEQP